MPHYSVFGLALHANLEVPGLCPTAGPARSPDVRVRLTGRRDRSAVACGSERLYYRSLYEDEEGTPILEIWKLPDGFRVRCADGADFVVDEGGTQIRGFWPATLTLEDATTYLLGPILAFVLRLRGVTSLHASAIAVDDHAVAFVGPTGAGKSTTAAAFARVGRPVLTDDLVVVREDGGQFLTAAGYPRLGLWPEAASFLFGSAESLPRLTPTWEKRYLSLNGEHPWGGGSLPLGAIYFLEPRHAAAQTPSVGTLTPGEALIRLLGHTHGKEVLEGDLRFREFELLSRLVVTLPVRRLMPHADPTRLDRLCQIVLDDVRGLCGPAASASA